MTLAPRLLSKDADAAAGAIAAELGGLPVSARRTINHDNGGEFARHEAVTDAIGLDGYFCDPHSPWQRGSIENANGRLRRELPRKTALTEYTDADIYDVVWNLNATPLKCLGYRTSIEAFAANLSVALEKWIQGWLISSARACSTGVRGNHGLDCWLTGRRPSYTSEPSP